MATGTVLLKLQGVYFKVEATLREWDEANKAYLEALDSMVEILGRLPSLEEAAKEERTGAARAPPRSGRDADREAAPPRSPRPPPAATLLAAQLSALARSHLRATSDAAELASCADKLERLAREAAGAAALGAGAGARAAAGGKAKAGRGGKAGRAADGPRPLASPPPVRPPLRAGSAWAGDVRQLAESARLEATFRERLTLELVGWRNAEEAARARAAAALSPCFRAAEFRDGPLALMKAMGPKPKHAA